MELSTEYLNASAIAADGHVRTLARSDVLDSHFFALGIGWGASREDIARDARHIEDDDGGPNPEGSGSVGAMADAMACNSLLEAMWGRA